MPMAALAPLDNEELLSGDDEFEVFPVAVGPELNPMPNVDVKVAEAGISVSSSASRDKI